MKTLGRKLAAFIALTMSGLFSVSAQSTAFTYQGRLTGSGTPASGSYDMRFALYDAAAAGNQIGVTLTNSPVLVSNGLFSVSLNFGTNAFNGAARWLEIGVRTNAGGVFRILPSRQSIAAAPHALYAAHAGNVGWTSITGVPAGFADGVDDGSSYTAGAGLALAAGQFSVSFGTNGVATTSARSDHNHLGQSWFNWVNLAGIPSGFGDGVDNDTLYVAGPGLSLLTNQFSVLFGTNGVATTSARSDHDHRGQPWFSWTNLANIPGGFLDGVDDGSSYTAGAGLALAAGQFSVLFGTNGVATTSARSDHNHIGQSWFAWGNLAGIPSGFGDGVDNDTTYTAGTGLALAAGQFSVLFGTNGVATTSARSDHDHRGQPWFSWTNLANIPGGFLDGVDDGSSYTAGAGLALVGSQFSVNFGTNGVATTSARSDHNHIGQSWFIWGNLAGIPAGFGDGVDNDTTYTAGTGLALAAGQFSVLFGTNGVATTSARSDHDHRGQPWFSWTNLANIPGGFVDGVDDGSSYTAGAGLALVGSQFSVNFGTNGAATTAARSDHDHRGQPWFSWTNLANIPGGFLDGVDDGSSYTAGTGLALVGNQFSVNFGTNGVATTSARSDHNHLGQSWFTWGNLAGIPSGFGDGVDNDTTYTAGTGLALAAGQFSVLFGTNGVATTSARSDHDHRNQPWFNWTNLAGIPAGFADGVDNGTSYTAGTGLQLVGSQFSVNFNGNGSATTASRSDHNHHGQSWAGTNFDGLIVESTATNGTGLHGFANTGIDGYGVFGEAFNGFGVVGSGGRYGVYGYSGSGHAIFGQSGGNQFFPQLVLLQDNTGDSCRLQMGASGWPQWDITVTAGATPRMEFFNGTTNVVLMDYLGNVTAKAFLPSSDRNTKENFQDLNPREVLERVTQLSIQSWNFKDDPAVRHVGPVAQDFHAAFKVGPDDRHIATVDADGVALAAIQGLDQVVKEKDAKIDALEKRLAELEKVVQTLTTKR